MVAAVCEFAGALLLGASVTTTIRSKIFDPSLYEDDPEILLLGFMTSIITATIMLLVATHFALPVSTTHTVVGCIMGFSICAKGFDSIDWDIGKQIFISWIASPGIAGILGLLFFGFVKIFILNHENAFLRTYYLFPFILCGGLGIDLFYIVYKGFNNFQWSKDTPITVVLPAAFGFGALCGVLWLYPIGPYAMNVIEKKREDRDLAYQRTLEANEAKILAEGEEGDSPIDDGDDTDPEQVKQSAFKKGWKKLMDNTVNQDLQGQSMQENKKAAELWDERAIYDEDAEFLFTYVQVFTAW
jgi:solute carrier family 20 (sodium-dependent phosphate transporter)